MQNLLKVDFTSHYGLPVSTVTNILLKTNHSYFEIEDNLATGLLQIHYIAGLGMAAYRNNSHYNVSIVNYDRFLTHLPRIFQSGKQRCDAIVYTDVCKDYFLLNELKDRKPRQRVTNKSTEQLRDSLMHLMAVPSISSFANGFTFKHCCIFNKQSKAPNPLTVITAFNRINNITSAGFQMSDPVIQSYGFKLFEFSGSQVYSL